MSNLDVSLDDMIKMNKKSGGPNPRGRSLNSGPGPSRRLPNRGAIRTTPYSVQKVQAPDAPWEHDMFADHAAPAVNAARADRVSAIETGTKLFISNLDYGVSNEDIKELFSDVGDIKRFTVHYDRSGRSKGTADVVFSRRKDAEAAVKRYNNVQLDGMPMKIEIVGTNTATAASVTLPTNGTYGNQSSAPRSSQGRGGVMGRLRGGGRPTRGRGQGGRGRGEKISKKVSAEDLDADLEKYHAEAMQTN